MREHAAALFGECVPGAGYVLDQTGRAKLTYPFGKHTRRQAGYMLGDPPVRQRIAAQRPQHAERPPLAEHVEQRQLSTGPHLTIPRHHRRLMVHLYPMHS